MRTATAAKMTQQVATQLHCTMGLTLDEGDRYCQRRWNDPDFDKRYYYSFEEMMDHEISWPLLQNCQRLFDRDYARGIEGNRRPHDYKEQAIMEIKDHAEAGFFDGGYPAPEIMAIATKLSSKPIIWWLGREMTPEEVEAADPYLRRRKKFEEGRRQAQPTQV